MADAESLLPMFPKPGQVKQVKVPLIVFDDGREICNCDTEAGREEYKRRRRVMWERQKHRCALEGVCPTCPGKLPWGDTTFDHQRGRGGGKRDDRIEVDGKWINAAVHLFCNNWKGSRSVPYNYEGGLGG